MNQISRAIQRKQSTRKWAYEATYFVKWEDAVPEQGKKLKARFSATIDEAGQSRKIDGFGALEPGGVKRLFKKALRKVFHVLYGFYVFPIYARQTHFNTQIIMALLTAEQQLEEQRESQIRTNQYFMQELDILKKQLAEQLSRQNK